MMTKYGIQSIHQLPILYCYINERVHSVVTLAFVIIGISTNPSIYIFIDKQAGVPWSVLPFSLLYKFMK